MRGTLTLSGMYDANPALFDGLALPEGVDKDTAIYEILESCTPLEVLYPNPFYLAESIARWSKSRLHSWTRKFSAINAEYEPLTNYDRHETVTENEQGTNTDNETESGTSTGAKTAFNDDAFKDTDRATGSNTRQGSGSNTKARTMTTRAYGNIGVTTSQQMLVAELDVTNRLDFYSDLACEFKTKFCLLVY